MCLLVHTPSASNPDLNHLGIVLTKPRENEGGTTEILLVKVTSVRPYVPHDKSCILVAGDHPMINHPSYIYYAQAKKYDVEIIKSGYRNTFKNYGFLEESVLQRVTEGLITSPQTPNILKNYYQES